MSVPAWPDFRVSVSDTLLLETNQEVWKGETDTGRPRTPIFSVMLIAKRGSLCEENARELLRDRFEREYARAHPNGCLGSHHG